MQGEGNCDLQGSKYNNERCYNGRRLNSACCTLALGCGVADGRAEGSKECDAASVKAAIASVSKSEEGSVTYEYNRICRAEECAACGIPATRVQTLLKAPAASPYRTAVMTGHTPEQIVGALGDRECRGSEGMLLLSSYAAPTALSIERGMQNIKMHVRAMLHRKLPEPMGNFP